MDNHHSEVVLRRSRRLASNTSTAINQTKQPEEADQDTLAASAAMGDQQDTPILPRSARLASTKGRDAQLRHSSTRPSETRTQPFKKSFPPELLDRIFMFALPGPRLVIVQSKVIDNIDQIDMEALNSSAIKALKGSDVVSLELCTTDAETVPTTLLHACVASRQVALKHYSLAFKAQLNGKPIYFDFKLDTLCLWSRSAINAFLGRPQQHDGLDDVTRPIFRNKAFEWAEKIQHITASYMNRHADQRGYLYRLPRLETLEMILPENFFKGFMGVFRRSPSGVLVHTKVNEQQFLTMEQLVLDLTRGDNQVQLIMVLPEMLKARIRAENPRIAHPALAHLQDEMRDDGSGVDWPNEWVVAAR